MIFSNVLQEDIAIVQGGRVGEEHGSIVERPLISNYFLNKRHFIQIPLKFDRIPPRETGEDSCSRWRTASSK